MNVLGPRLNRLAQRIKKCYTIIDIGCDHGKIVKYILDNNLAEKVIASDISAKSLDKARRLTGPDPRVSYRVGDGLSVLSGDIPDIIIIAGMGGRETEKILKDNPNPNAGLLLVPHKNPYELRKYLNSAGYKIVYDETVKDNNKFYDIIEAESGRQRLNERELMFGVTNLKVRGNDFIEMLTGQRNKIISYGQDIVRKKYELLLKITDEVLSGENI